MPNRMIKESHCSDTKVASLSDFEFRLWVGLITQVDDSGRGDARPAIIKGKVFPLREGVTFRNIETAMQGLASKGLIDLYEVDDQPYFWFPTWHKHQRVRGYAPKFPGPDEANKDLADNRRQPPPTAAVGRQPPPENKNEKENEREKEKENELCAHARETLHQLGTNLEPTCDQLATNLRPTCGQLAAKPEPANTVPERDMFSEFWGMYPKKVAKQAAEKAYKRLNPSAALHKKILENIILQKKSRQWQENGGQYIPNPATYINGRRWEDEGVKNDGAHREVSSETGAKITVDRFGNKVYQ